MALENVVLFPHLGSASVYTRTQMDQLVVDNLVAWAAGGRRLRRCRRHRGRPSGAADRSSRVC